MYQATANLVFEKVTIFEDSIAVSFSANLVLQHGIVYTVVGIGTKVAFFIGVELFLVSRFGLGSDWLCRLLLSVLLFARIL